MASTSSDMPTWHGTTVLTIRKGGKVVIAGDGQVSLGQTVIKSNARKVRPIGASGKKQPNTLEAASLNRAKQRGATLRVASARVGEERVQEQAYAGGRATGGCRVERRCARTT